MAMIVRGRSRRSRSALSRHVNVEDNVVLDHSKEPSENLWEILQAIGSRSGTKKLSYYNAFVRLCYRCGGNFGTHLRPDDVLCCLRMGLFHECKVLRTAALRALRYYVKDKAIMESLLRLHIDYIITRSLDICIDEDDMERVQALRLIRKMMRVSPESLPQSLLNAIVAIASDGVAERDKMVKICLASLCELAFTNPNLVADSGGIAVLLRNVLDCHLLARINESLLASILYMLNHPRTRHFIKADIDLEQMLAPFTDCHYCYSADSSDVNSSEERENRFAASKMAIATIMRSWPGMMRFCKPDGSGLQSFLGALYLPQMETRKELMDILYDVFRLPVPAWTDCFTAALLSVEPYSMRESWRLTEGFVAEEGKAILPHLAKTRPNLVENHMALLLSVFISAGLLEAMIEVIATSENHVSVRACILLGELLHMANLLIPYEVSSHSHCLPTLVSIATSLEIPAQERNRAKMAVSCLSRLHSLKKRGPIPCSLFLSQILQRVADYKKERPARVDQDKLLQCLSKEYDSELLNQALRDSQVLISKNYKDWDWDLILAILKWPDNNLKKLEEQVSQRFLRRLVFFMKPTCRLFGSIPLSQEGCRKYSKVALSLVDYLMDNEDPEGPRFKEEWLSDIAECLAQVRSDTTSDDVLFTPSYLAHTMSQEYFLILGRFSASKKGSQLLEYTGVYQYLLDIVTITTCDTYIKLIVSSLDYTEDGMARLILSKALTASSESARLYTASFIRVLLRARVPFLSSWGMEMLVMQLYDQSRAVAMEALSVLSEACEEEVNLVTLANMRPSVLHLGYKGAMLLARLLSIPNGFKSLRDANYIEHELDKWHKGFNEEYVVIVEERLNQALTTYEKTYDGTYTRRSARKVQREDVYLPVHLYGQLVQHKSGFQLLEKQPYLQDFFTCIREQELHTEADILQLKASLWAVGHIGTSVWGLSLVFGENIIPDIIKLAEESGIFSIRGTAFYVLGLLGSTRKGADVLDTLGWESVRHQHGELWPILEMEQEVDVENDMLSTSGSFSQLGSQGRTSSTVLSELGDQVPRSPKSGFVTEDMTTKSRSSTEDSTTKSRSGTEDSGTKSRSGTDNSGTKSCSSTEELTAATKSRSISDYAIKSRSSTAATSDDDWIEFEAKVRTDTGTSLISSLAIDNVFEDEEPVEEQPWTNSTQSLEEPASDSEGFHTPPLDIKHNRTLPANELDSKQESSSDINVDCDTSPFIHCAVPKGKNHSLVCRPGRSASDPAHRHSPQLAHKGVNSDSTNGREPTSPWLTPPSCEGPRLRSQSMREGRTYNDSAHITKTHSDSGATESTTSGVSSYDSGSQAGQHLPAVASSNSISTMDAARLRAATNMIHPSDVVRKQANLKRVPSLRRRFSTISLSQLSPLKAVQAQNLSESMLVYHSSRDFSGYTALKELRWNQALSAEFSMDFGLCNFMVDGPLGRTTSLDFRLGKPVATRHMSFSSLPEVDITVTPSVGDKQQKQGRAGGRAEYIGLTLPVDVSMLFQVNEGEDMRSTTKVKSSGSQSDSDSLQKPCGAFDAIKTSLSTGVIQGPLGDLPGYQYGHKTGAVVQAGQFISTVDKDAAMALIASVRARTRMSKIKLLRSVSQIQGGEQQEDSHNPEQCLGCFSLNPPAVAGVQIAVEDTDAYTGNSSWTEDSKLPNGMPILLQPKGLKSRASSFSDMVGSVSSVTSTESSAKVLMNEENVSGQALVRQEILRLIVSLSSSVGIRSSEQGLLILKQKYPSNFQELCLYSEVCRLMAQHHYRLKCRRFIQELFQDIDFTLLYRDSENLLGMTIAQQEPANKDVTLEQVTESTA